MKRLSVLLACVLVAVAQAGFCTGAKEQIVLRVLASDAIKPLPGTALVPAWDAAEAAFLKTHPNVKLEYEMMPTTEVFTKYVLLIQQGNPPDVVHLSDVLIYPYARSGFLGDLTPYMKKKELDDFTDFANSLKYEGKVYAIPMSTDVRIRVYNKAHFRKAGLDDRTAPKTWEEVIETGKKLNHVMGPDQWAFGVIAGPNFHTPLMWMPQVWMAGGSLLTADGRADFTNEAVYRAAGFYYDLIYKHGIMPKTVLGMDEDALERAVLAGQISQAVMGNWKYGQLIEKGFPAADLGWAPLPYPAGGTQATLGGSWNWSISPQTKNPKVAYELIMAMTCDAFTIAEGQAGYRVPVRKSIANNPAYATNAVHKEMIQYSVAYGRSGLATPNPIGFATALITALQTYWGGAASAQAAFGAQEAEYNKSLK
jgi:multiple sugar transport system substrate-binding protein